MIELWLFLSYVVGTLFGLWVGYHRGVWKGTENSIDNLIKRGYLKTRGDEILKHNEND